MYVHCMSLLNKRHKWVSACNNVLTNLFHSKTSVLKTKITKSMQAKIDSAYMLILQQLVINITLTISDRTLFYVIYKPFATP
jgi:hypothetical protein